MKLDLKTWIAGPALVAFCLACTGCSLIGSTVPIPEDAPVLEVKSNDPFDVDIETDEPEQWSRLVKEGREHLRMGRYDAAEQTLLSAFRLSKRFRQSDVRRQVSYGNLERVAARYRLAHNRSAEMRVLRIISIETADQSVFAYPGLSDLMVQLGELHSREDANEDARVSYLRALDLRIEKGGADSSTLIDVYRRLSQVEISLEEFDEAVAHAERGLAIAEALFGRNAPLVITAKLQAALAYFESEQYPESEEQYLSVLEILREVEPSGVSSAVPQNGLASLYLETDRLDEALVQVDLALEILERAELSGLSRAMILDTKAQILAARGESESAGDLFVEVMAGSVNAQPAVRRTLLESFESFLLDQDQTDEADEIRRQINGLSGIPQGPADPDPLLDSPDLPESAFLPDPPDPNVPKNPEHPTHPQEPQDLQAPKVLEFPESQDPPDLRGLPDPAERPNQEDLESKLTVSPATSSESGAAAIHGSSPMAEAEWDLEPAAAVPGH